MLQDELAFNRRQAEEDADKAEAPKQRQLLNEQMQVKWLASLGKVASAFLTQSNYVKALQFSQERIKVSQRLMALEQTNDEWRRQSLLALEQIGNVYKAKGDLEAAIDAFRQELSIAQDLSARHQTHSYAFSPIRVYRELAAAYETKGDPGGKLGVLEDELTFNRRQAEEDAGNARRAEQRQPLNEDIQRHWLASLDKVASAYLARSNYVQALQFSQERLKASQSRMALEQTNDVWRWQKLLALEQVGNVHQANGELAMAIDTFREQLRTAQDLAARNQTNSRYERSVGVAFQKLASALYQHNDVGSAAELWQKAVDVARPLFERAPSNSEAANDLSNALGGLALALENKRDTNAVVQLWEQTASFYERVHQEFKKSGNTNVWNVSPVAAYGKLFDCYLAQGNVQKAQTAVSNEIKFTTEALEILPSVGGYGNLAFDYCKIGNFMAAKDAAETALSLVKTNENEKAVWIYGNLAYAHMFLGNQTEAERIHRQYRNVPDIGNGTERYSWKQATRDDFELFRKLGISHPGMDAIRHILGIGE